MTIEIKTKTVKLAEIQTNPDNPRTITEKEMAYLVKSLQEFPEMMKLREIVVDENMMIIGGNMRFRALQEIGEKECIVKIVTGLSSDQKREFIIKDNTQFGGFDMDMIANTWSDLPLIEWGFDMPKAWGAPEDDSGGETEDPESEEPTIVICPKCKHEFSVLKEK